MQEQDTILVDRSDAAIARVTLNRPDRKNAMTLAMWRDLAALFESLGAEAELRAILLTGAGGAFCAGADVAEFAELRHDAATGAAYTEAVDACIRAIREAPRATYAAISGPALGGGCALALACDFRIADETALFSIPAAKLGVVYGVPETRALVEAVGLAAAKDLLFTARRIGAREAREIGLVTELAAEDALSAARERAAALRGSAPLSIAGTKTILQGLAAEPGAAAMSEIRAAMTRALESEDYQEALRAFAEKRPPEFRGR